MDASKQQIVSIGNFDKLIVNPIQTLNKYE